MATNRRYLSRRRSGAEVAELTPWQKWALTSSCPVSAALLSGWGADDSEIWREAWELHGEDLLVDFIAKYPGCRPWPWWVFTHGQERPIVNHAPPEVEAQFRAENTIFGYLHSSILHGHGRSGELVPLQEPEAEYLERLGLLTDSEIAALEADDDDQADDDDDDDEAFDADDD